MHKFRAAIKCTNEITGMNLQEQQMKYINVSTMYEMNNNVVNTVPNIGKYQMNRRNARRMYQ